MFCRYTVNAQRNKKVVSECFWSRLMNVPYLIDVLHEYLMQVDIRPILMGGIHRSCHHCFLFSTLHFVTSYLL